MNDSRFLLRSVLGGLAALTLLGSPRLGTAAGVVLPQVTVGVVNWIGYGPIYCAVTNGYYKKYGIDVKPVTFSDNSLMSGALEGGEITASTLTYDQVLTANLPVHVTREHAFCRVLIVRATGGMNVVIARIPTEFGGIDPAV